LFSDCAVRDLYLGLGCGVDWANYYGESEAGSHPMVYGNLSRERWRGSLLAVYMRKGETTDDVCHAFPPYYAPFC
jgi:hypothetical protein